LKRPTTPWTRWRRWGSRWPRSPTPADEGVQLFAEAFDKLLAAVEQTRQAAAGPKSPSRPSPCPLPRGGRAGVTRRLARGTNAALVGTRCHPVDGTDEASGSAGSGSRRSMRRTATI
jgi:hypothetical protein